MATFKCEVVEVRAVRRTYYIEAEDSFEARKKADAGDTESESGDKYEVVERVIEDVEVV